MAELSIENYDVHQAIIDVLAEHQNDILAPLKISAEHFLCQCKKTTELAVVHIPTAEDDSGALKYIINRINGPTPQQVTEAQVATAEQERATQRARDEVRERVTTASLRLGIPPAAAAVAGEAAAEASGGKQAASSADKEGGETPNPYVTPRSGPTSPGAH